MNPEVKQWIKIVEQLGTKIGTLEIQLAAANVKIAQLESERVKEDGTSEQHDSSDSAKGAGRTADADSNA